MGAAQTIQRLSLHGRILAEGVRCASACSDEPILCIASGQMLAFAVSSEARLLFSWQFRLPTAIQPPIAFVIPKVIVRHLIASPGGGEADVDLTLRGNEVTFTSRDARGPFELRWQSDLRRFPAPMEMNRLLAVPPNLIRLDYLQLSDSIHRAVARLITLESQQHIHRTRLALLLSLSDGHLMVDGREISDQGAGHYYFDPRLMLRALEHVRAEQVEIGLTSLSLRRAILSIVERRPEYLLHCALMSIGLDTQLLLPPSPRRGQQAVQVRQAS